MTVGDIILSHPWHYQIKRHDGKFAVIDGKDSRVIFETPDLTDAKTAFEYARDQMTNTGKKTTVKSDGGFSEIFINSGKILLDSDDQYQCWEGCGGPRGTSSHIRVTTNEPIFEFTGGSVFNSINDLYLTHNNASYSTGLIRYLDRAIGNQVNGCRFSDSATYAGYAIAMEILGTGSGFSQYKNHISNCESNGFEAFKYYNDQKVNVGSDYFISTNNVVDTDIWNAKHAIKIDAILDSQILLERWNNIAYQYISANPLVSDEAVFNLNGDSGTGAGSMWQWTLSNVMAWDIPSNVNFANVTSSSELMLINCQPSERIGGNSTGISKVKRLDYYTHKRGTHNFAAEYNKRDYIVTHGLNLIPQCVSVTITNNDTNAIIYAVIPKTLITDTQFTVRFPYPPPLPNRSGYNNLDIAWEVIY